MIKRRSASEYQGIVDAINFHPSPVLENCFLEDDKHTRLHAKTFCIAGLKY